jgi:hypothetical protein
VAMMREHQAETFVPPRQPGFEETWVGRLLRRI